MLGIFLYNTAGYFITFKLAQAEIKQEIKRKIKQGIKPEEYTLIKFELSEIDNINWIKKNKEFIYSEQMFDIVKSIRNDSSITYYCINDKQEKKLFANLDDQIQKHIENNKNAKDHSKKNSDHQIKTYFFETNTHIFFQKISLHTFNDYNESLFSIAIAIPTPPPDFS